MEKLGKTVKISGVGLLRLTAKLLERKGKKCLYLRSDGVYEIFKIKIAEAAKIFNKEYPKRELYPSSEDFGQTAWCFHDKKKAYECYNNL